MTPARQAIATAVRETRQAAADEGKCYTCTTRTPRRGRKNCEHCLDIARRSMRRRRHGHEGAP